MRVKLADSRYLTVRTRVLEMPGPVRLVIRLIVLAAASSAVAYGLLAWQHQGFTLVGVWLVDNDWRLHPVHFLVVGVGLIPPTMWDIFTMEVDAAKRGSDEQRSRNATDG
ncbi:MAG: hypothetical protein F4Y41_06350 [Gammaproteobacteria bacterium]|nr:hypothetical protein [Gammaproteobacteria bacterium]MYF27613.1 hypothetical protein [Gammaproteobacteria bacterium]